MVPLPTPPSPPVSGGLVFLFVCLEIIYLKPCKLSKCSQKMGNTIVENRVLLFHRRNKGRKSNFAAYVFTDHCHRIILCSDYVYFGRPSCSTETQLSVSPLQYYYSDNRVLFWKERLSVFFFFTRVRSWVRFL